MSDQNQHYDHAFELFPDAPLQTYDIRDEPIDVSTNNDALTGMMGVGHIAFTEASFSPEHVAKLLHTFSPFAEIEQPAPADDTAEAVDRLLDTSSIFFRGLDPASRAIIAGQLERPGIRPAIKELVSWMVQTDSTTDTFLKVRLQPLKDLEGRMRLDAAIEKVVSHVSISSLAALFERVEL